MSELDPTSGVPLYRQIKDILRAEISDGTADPATPMTEERLLRRFDVSRAPIRQALAQLASEGYVHRKQGRGTFPVPGARVHRPADVRPGALYTYLADQGFASTSTVTGVARVEPPDRLSALLRLRPDERLLHFTRLIAVDGSPLVEADVYIRAPDGFAPDAEELQDRGSAFELLEQSAGVVLERAENEAWASAATPAQAAALGVVEGSPILVIETTFFATGGTPVGWRSAIHQAEEFTYRFVTSG